MARILLASIIGALVAFFWGYTSWVVLDLYKSAFHNLPETKSPMVEGMKADKLASGAYSSPAKPDKNADAAANDAWTAKAKAGPMVTVLYRAEGSAPMTTMMARGFGFNVVACFLMACMMVAGHLRTWGMRFTLAAIMSAFAVMASHALNWNWFSYPDAYSMAMAAEVMVTWLLAGAVVAMIVKPAPASA